MTTVLRDFLEIPYEQLEEMNLSVKQARLNREPPDKLREARVKYLTDERRIKAVTVCFTDLEGRLHMLDYDKKYLLKSERQPHVRRQLGARLLGAARVGPAAHHRLGAFYWLPADVFGPGKVLVFADVLARDGSPYPSDMRGRLKHYTEQLLHQGEHALLRRPGDRRLPLQRAGRRARATTRRASSTTSRPAATTTPCRATS